MRDQRVTIYPKPGPVGPQGGAGPQGPPGEVTNAQLTAALSAYLPLAGGVLTGLLSFSGTNHAGVRLNNLTTAQRNAIGSPAAGSIVWNTTDNRVQVHNGTGWTNGFARIDGDTFTGNVGSNGTIQSNASTGFAVGAVANLRRISYSSSPFTRFVFLSDSNSTDRIAVDGLSVGGGLVNVQPPASGIQSIGPNLIFNTYVSDTNFERGFARWASNIFQIGTEKGSLGGAARALALQTDGVTRLTIGAAGTVSTDERWAIREVRVSGGAGLAFDNVTPAVLTGAAPWIMYTANGALLRTRDQVNGRDHIQLTAGASAAAATTRFASAVIADADLTITPSTSRTLSTNGQFTVEMTSNIAGNLVYRGSDGVTRRMALTFS